MIAFGKGREHGFYLKENDKEIVLYWIQNDKEKVLGHNWWFKQTMEDLRNLEKAHGRRLLGKQFYAWSSWLKLKGIL